MAERKMRSDALANRDKIVAAARAVFAEHGATAPFDAIAQRAGVGNATLYRHFPNAATLHAAILERRLEEAIELLASLESETDPWTVIETFLRWVAAAPDISFVNLLIGGFRERDRVDQLGEEILRMVGRRVEEAAELGVVKPDITAEHAITVIFAITQVGLQGTLSRAQKQRFTQLLIDGLKA